MKCPHCGKELKIVPAVAWAEPEPEPSKEQRKLPLGGIDDALRDYAELLHITQGEGKILYQLKDYQPTDTWRKIDSIMSTYGAKYIKGGSKPGHWEVPT